MLLWGCAAGPRAPQLTVDGAQRIEVAFAGGSTVELVVVSEQAQADADGNTRYIAEQRAIWEAARRRGRSKVCEVITDSWRDSKGDLWRPNALVPIQEVEM